MARIMISNIGQKLTKQEKDRALIKVIKNERRFILESLMRDSVLSNIDQLEEKIEQIFEDMTNLQQTQLEKFFSNVEAKVDQFQEKVDAVTEGPDSQR